MLVSSPDEEALEDDFAAESCSRISDVERCGGGSRFAGASPKATPVNSGRGVVLCLFSIDFQRRFAGASPKATPVNSGRGVVLCLFSIDFQRSVAADAAPRVKQEFA